MGFFDVNIPIEDEPKDKNRAKHAKDTRVRLVVKAMELGYSGIAFNRSISGVISDSDRCTITTLPLQSLLEASPVLAETVRFHRKVLGVPVGETFKQYTRLTVIVETMLQAAAVNPHNPVLRGYDLVAIRPMDEQTFEHACKNLEVDLISVDFGERLPFQIKRASVKIAMERGIFFEIMYSPAISNFRSRREMFSSAKVLINYTHGRNIIVSSAASRVNELRGPNDVANMSTLFGLSMEHARAAVSKNCRTVIHHGLTRKKCYKSAIQVENHSPDGIFGSDKAWFNVSEVWDPISSGDGDLILKTNLVENVQPNDKKGPSSRAKKRRRASSSQNTGVLVHNDNQRMGLNARTSTCGLQLNNSTLQTANVAKKSTDVTLSDGDTVMEELKSRMKNMGIPHTIPYGVHNFNIPDDVEFLAVNNSGHQLVSNGVTWVTEYKSSADQCVTQQSSIANCNADIDPVNGTGIKPPGLSFNRDKGPSVTVVHTDALRVCNDNSLPSHDINGLVGIRCDNIFNSNTQIKLPESKKHDSTIGSVMEQVIQVPGSVMHVDGLESRENRRLFTEPSILQGDLISDDALTDTTMSAMGAEELTAVCSNGASEMELDCKTKFLALDDNGQQLVPRRITEAAQDKSSRDQQVTQLSSVVNCNADVDPVNVTGITPPEPSFVGDKGPSVTVHMDALQVCNENSSLSDDITGLVDIRSDDLCNSNPQVMLPVSNINDNLIGNMMGQVILVPGSGVTVDGLESRANKRLFTGTNTQQGDFISDDALIDVTMPSMGARELTAVCSKGASEMELGCKTGTQGRLRRKKLPRVHVLSFRGMLRWPFFKKRVPPRKRNFRKQHKK